MAVYGSANMIVQRRDNCHCFNLFGLLEAGVVSLKKHHSSRSGFTLWGNILTGFLFAGHDKITLAVRATAPIRLAYRVRRVGALVVDGQEGVR